MSITRDAYAKEVMKVAEAAFHRDEAVLCPHDDCNEQLSVTRQNAYSSRVLCCPVHGSIFKEQESAPFGKLDWESHAHDYEKFDQSEHEVAEEDMN